MNNTNRYYSQSETVYMKDDARRYIDEDAPRNILWFRENTTYYQTFGGGPEGGYFVRVLEGEDGVPQWGGCWQVSRGWFQHWKARKISNVVGIMYVEDEEGAKIRLVKQRRARQAMAQQWAEAQR